MSELVLICIPTCKRPKMLAACLESVAKTTLPQNYEVQLLVLDNDANRTAEKVFRAQQFPFSARYGVEVQRGLCAVRNRALDEAAAADYLAFLDDDDVVDANWLCALMDGLQESGADAINGYVHDVYANGEPWWILPEKLSVGEEVHVGVDGISTNLLLMKARLFKDLRFDMQFNFIGAEDYDFFLRASRRGFLLAQTGKAYAQSTVPPVRATFTNYFCTRWQRNSGYVLSHRLQEGRGKSLRFLFKGMVKFCKGVLHCIIGLLLGKKMIAKGIKNIAAGGGLYCGFFARGNYQKYLNIEGE